MITIQGVQVTTSELCERGTFYRLGDMMTMHPADLNLVLATLECVRRYHEIQLRAYEEEKQAEEARNPWRRFWSQINRFDLEGCQGAVLALALGAALTLLILIV